MKNARAQLPLKTVIPEHTLSRVPLYHQILSDLEARGEQYVSSKYLANFFQVDDTQVRKDVSIIGYKGKPKAGYSVSGLRQAIAEFLGLSCQNEAILIGTGKLGSALAEYPGLSEYGLKLVAVFDNNPQVIGKIIGPFTILSMESLSRVIRSFQVEMAIITVPKNMAQKVCDRIIALGIKAIWNFAPLQLSTPTDVIIRNENLAMGFAILSHYLKARSSAAFGAPGAEGGEQVPRKSE